MNPLESVRYELIAAISERTKLDAKIKTLEQTIKLLEPIYGEIPVNTGLLSSIALLSEEELSSLGLTAAVERVLISIPDKWLPPTSVRNALVEAGFEVAGDNPMASIHQVLKRLVARGNWFVSDEIDGQTMYKYDSARHPFPYVAAQKATLHNLANAGRRKTAMPPPPGSWGVPPRTDKK